MVALLDPLVDWCLRMPERDSISRRHEILKLIDQAYFEECILSIFDKETALYPLDFLVEIIRPYQ